MGRPWAAKRQKNEASGTLRQELHERIERGRCAYCQTPAMPDRPLTREHVIPRARGGRRRDVRIIVPACRRCNHDRGCGELIPFLLARPRRLSSLLDYLAGLSPESLREVDLRIFAEVYAAQTILEESAARGPQWKRELGRLCSGRLLHRRRYAARRALSAVTLRIAALREREWLRLAPSCRLPGEHDGAAVALDPPIERLGAQLLGLLALLWHVSAELAEREIARELAVAGGAARHALEEAYEPGLDARVRSEEGTGSGETKSRARRQRRRVDERRGGTARSPRGASLPRGRPTG